MNIDKVRTEIAEDEGCKYEIYLDHLHLPTFGIGHLITKDDEEYGKPVGTPVDEDRGNDCFEKDLDTAISECAVLYEEFEEMPGEVQEILVNMMFNMGRTRLSGFKNFKKALDEGNWSKAATEGRDSKWYRQVTNRAERLMGRLENV